MEILFLASSVLSLFFIVLLLGKKNKSLSDKILVGWFVLLFSNVSTFYLIIVDLAPQLLILLLDNSVFIHGPVLWFYTSAISGTSRKIGGKNLIHFLPFTVFFLLALLIQQNGSKYADYFNYTLIVLKFISVAIYILASLKIIIKHRRRITQILSSKNQMELKWLFAILIGGLMLIVFGIISMLLYFLTPLDIPNFGGKYLNIVYSISIMVLGYYGFRQTSIFIPSHLKKEFFDFENQEIKTEKQKNNPGTNKQMEKLYMELLDFMETNKPYVDKNLTLFKLAEDLKISENKLSHIINTQSGLNFFEFINKYRVEDVIARMKGGEHLKSTLLGIAYDSGFNSKASFNRAFKKFTQQTPSEFLNSKI